jgi:hypothetical protein
LLSVLSPQFPHNPKETDSDFAQAHKRLHIAQLIILFPGLVEQIRALGFNPFDMKFIYFLLLLLPLVSSPGMARILPPDDWGVGLYIDQDLTVPFLN